MFSNKYGNKTKPHQTSKTKRLCLEDASDTHVGTAASAVEAKLALSLSNGPSEAASEQKAGKPIMQDQDMRQHQTPRAVAVIGELNVDLIASGLTSAPVLGQEVLAEDFQTVLGGASAIFACGAARLGHPVSFFSKVGDDDYGRFCLNAVQKAGISTKNVAQVATSKTGVTISLSTRRDRALVTVLGAISELKAKDLDLQALRGHSHLHMTSFFLQTALRPSFPQILRQARKLGLTTSFDPNSDPMSSWGPDVWRVIDETTILFINQEEALHLTRKKNVREALQQLAERAPCVVVKLGPRGAIAAADGQVVSAPPFKVRPVDTTGAGDSFAAGFVHAFLSGRDLRGCLVEGNACGALSTQQVGGTAGQPDLKTLEKFLHRNRQHQ
jgi:sugar/nucleoside kinase (ribokinase family)